METVNRAAVASHGGRESCEERYSTGGVFQGSETILYDTVMLDTCCYTFVKTEISTPPRMSPHLNYGLEVITC